MLFGKYRNTLNGLPRGPALVSNEINDRKRWNFNPPFDKFE